MKKSVASLATTALLLTSMTSSIACADQDALPAALERMFETAASDTDAFQAILETALKTWPDQRADILKAASKYSPGIASEKGAVNVSDSAMPTAGEQVVAAELAGEVEPVAEPAPALFSLSGWTGEINAGGSQNTGNTDQNAFYAGLKLNRSIEEQFEHALRVRLDFAKTDGVSQTEKGLGIYEFTWHGLDGFLLSNMFQAEYDRFAGYDYRLVDTINIGRKLIDSDKQKLRIEVGPGLRYTNFAMPDIIDPLIPVLESQTEIVARAAVNYELQLLENLKLVDRLTFEYGSVSTTIRNILELDTALSKSFSVRTSHEIKYESGAPTDKSKTDSISRLSVVFGF